MVEPGDLVLVKVVAFDGKHKIADRWENDTYAVLSQPNPGIPVYVVQREDKGGPKRTLHRNLLLPINSLPLDSGTTNDRNTVMNQNDDARADTHSVDEVRDNDSDSISSDDTQDTHDDHDVIQIDEDLDSDDPDPAEHAAMPPIVPRHIEPEPVVHQPVITEPANPFKANIRVEGALVVICVYIKVVISTSQLLHINYFMTFPFVTSYFGSVTLEIIIKSRGLTIGEVVTL